MADITVWVFIVHICCRCVRPCSYELQRRGRGLK